MQIDEQFSFIRTFKYVRRDNDNPFFIKYFGKDYQKEKHQHIIQGQKNNNVVREKINEQVPEARFNQKNNKQQKYRQTQMKQIEQLKNFAKVDMKKLKKQQRKQIQKAKKFIEKETPRKANKLQQKLKQQINNNKKNNNILDLPELKLVNRRSKSIDVFQPREFTAFKKKQSIRQQEKNFKRQGKYLFDQYLDIEQIQQSRRNGQNKYFKGIIQFSERLKTFAKIKTLQVDGNLITEGRNKNRCIHEDEVYFEIIEQNPLKTLCKVVYIIQPQVKRHIVGRIDFLQFKRLYYITPNNQRFIAMNVRMNEIQRSWLKQINEKYFLVQFHSWKRDSQYPQCTVISQFGKFGEIDIEADALLKTHNVYEKEYTQVQIEGGLKKFIDQADVNGQYQISKQQIAKRCDLRNQMIFTIDPLTARDFDDALSIKKLTQEDLKRLNIRTRQQNEVYEIGVHIADASFFVQQNSVIDEQAKRTTSVYLVHKVLPMLPRVLCQTMCSLNPGLQRLTLSVWFYIDIQGNMLPGVKFDRTVIKSRARFTYQQAQLIIEGKINSQKQMEQGFGCTDQKYQKEIFHSIKVMNTIAMNLRKNRIQGGSLIFETPKKSFKLNEQHFPIQYQIKNRIQSNFLVEEYMLIANKKVGQILVEHLRPQALLRRHQFPGQKKISNFQAFMKKIGQPMKIQKHTKIQEQINKILTDPSIKMAIKEIIKHEMVYLLQMAEYFVVSQIPEKDWLHYALNMPVYTHFTSPIRRYPDIIVHRQLISVIQAKKENRSIILNNQNILKSLVERCNKNKVSAKKVSTGCQKVFLCLYLKDKPVFTQAILVAVQEWGLKISIPKYDCRVMLKLKDLKNLKVLKCDKTQDDKKYMQVEVKDEESSMKLILKELQQIHVRLGSTQTFPIDYQVSLCFPHPKKAGQKLIIK